MGQNVQFTYMLIFPLIELIKSSGWLTVEYMSFLLSLILFINAVVWTVYASIAEDVYVPESSFYNYNMSEY